MKLWNIILWISVFILAMLLLTYLVPDIKTFAQGIADQKDLPLWIVALFAPVLLVIQKIRQFFAGFTGESRTEREIRELNEEIKAEMKKIREEVQHLDSWLKEKISEEMRHIQDLNTRITSLQQRRAAISEQIETVEAMDPMEFLADKSEQQREALRTEFLERHDIVVSDADVID